MVGAGRPQQGPRRNVGLPKARPVEQRIGGEDGVASVEQRLYGERQVVLPGDVRQLAVESLPPEDARALVDVLAGLPCAVMVSGYDSPIYDSSPLATWRTIEFNAMTRGGIAIERLWMNYPEPDALHDLRYLGSNFRERERIKRKKARWQAKLAKLDPLERAAIMECLRELEAAE